MSRRCAIVAAVVLVSAIAGTATAQQAQITQLLFTTSGDPELVASPTPDGEAGEVVAWRKCPPGAACEDVPMERPDDRQIAPGDVPAGTTFEVDVRSSGTGQTTTDRSPPWGGQVTPTRAPAAEGTIRVGGIVHPIAAEWTGGWGDDRSVVGLEVCRRSTGSGCETLSSTRGGVPTCPRTAAVIGHRYRGWWVRAVDWRVPADMEFPDVGYSRAREIPVPPSDRTAARSAFVGRVARRGAGFAECRRPRISIYRAARRRGGRLEFGTVRCVSACEVVLTVRHGRRLTRRTQEPHPDRNTVAIPARTRIGVDRGRVTIVVNSRHARQRLRVRLPRTGRAR